MGRAHRGTWRSRLTDWRRHLFLAVPPLAALVFVATYASPMPLTDEWLFTKAVMRLQEVDLSSLHGLRQALDLIPKRLGDHWVAAPFLVYWPVAEWGRMDSRWVVCVTLAAFAVQALVYRRFLVRSSLWAFPIVLLLFSPAHYMELLWGWLITFTFSVGFAVVGLLLVDRMATARGRRGQLVYLAAAALSLFVAALSSAGGLLGFPSAMLLAALKLRGRARVATLGLLVLATAVVALALARSPSRTGFRGHGLAEGLTLIGGAIWSSPVGIREFGVDRLSATGLVVVVCAAAIAVRAAAVGALQRLALPLCLAAFGLLGVTSVAIVRPWIANWHFQLALPLVCGAYAAGYRLWKEDRSPLSAVPFFTLLGTMLLSVLGCYAAFARHGPTFRGDALSIEIYAQAFLEQPDRAKPYPRPHSDINERMLLFLSANDHPLYGDSPEPAVLTAPPTSARTFLEQEEVERPFAIAGGGGELLRLTVALPDDVPLSGVLAVIGSSDLVLRKIHPGLAGIPCCGEPGIVCYRALIVPRMWPRGVHPAQLWLYQ